MDELPATLRCIPAATRHLLCRGNKTSTCWGRDAWEVWRTKTKAEISILPFSFSLYMIFFFFTKKCIYIYFPFLYYMHFCQENIDFVFPCHYTCTFIKKNASSFSISVHFHKQKNNKKTKLTHVLLHNLSAHIYFLFIDQ